MAAPSRKMSTESKQLLYSLNLINEDTDNVVLSSFKVTPVLTLLSGTFSSLKNILGDLRILDEQRIQNACDIIQGDLKDIESISSKFSESAGEKINLLSINEVLFYVCMRNQGFIDHDKYYESAESLFPEFSLKLYLAFVDTMKLYGSLSEQLINVPVASRKELLLKLIKEIEDKDPYIGLPLFQCLLNHLLELIATSSCDITFLTQGKETNIMSAALKLLNGLWKASQCKSEIEPASWISFVSSIVQTLCQTWNKRICKEIEAFRSQIMAQIGNKIHYPSDDFELDNLDWFKSDMAKKYRKVDEKMPTLMLSLMLEKLAEILKRCFDCKSSFAESVSIIVDSCHCIYSCTRGLLHILGNSILTSALQEIAKVAKDGLAKLGRSKISVDAESNEYIVTNGLPNVEMACVRLAAASLEGNEASIECLEKNASEIGPIAFVSLVKFVHDNNKKNGEIIERLRNVCIASFSSSPLLFQDAMRLRCLRENWNETLLANDFLQKQTIAFNQSNDKNSKQFRQTIERVSVLCLQSTEKTIRYLIETGIQAPNKITLSSKLLCFLRSSCLFRKNQDSAHSLLTSTLYDVACSVDKTKEIHLLKLIQSLNKKITVDGVDINPLINWQEVVRSFVLPGLNWDEKSQDVPSLIFSLKLLQSCVKENKTLASWSCDEVSFPAIVLCLIRILDSCPDVWESQQLELRTIATNLLESVLSRYREESFLFPESEIRQLLKDSSPNSDIYLFDFGRQDLTQKSLETSVSTILRLVARGHCEANNMAENLVLSIGQEAIYPTLLCALAQVLPTLLFSEWARVLRFTRSVLAITSNEAATLASTCLLLRDVIRLMRYYGASDYLDHILHGITVTIKEFLEEDEFDIECTFESLCELVSYVPVSLYSTIGVLLLELCAKINNEEIAQRFKNIVTFKLENCDVTQNIMKTLS